VLVARPAAARPDLRERLDEKESQRQQENLNKAFAATMAYFEMISARRAPGGRRL
jgi:hypothetical protein